MEHNADNAELIPGRRDIWQASAMLPPVVTRHAPHGMVSTIDHLATETGVALLRAGGSAVDAAIGANAVLAVTCPNACGMGGDLWALVHHEQGPPAALDASGRAGSLADSARARAEGLAEIPLKRDPRAITMPGAVDGWLALHDRFGRLDLGAVLGPAAAYAEHGFPTHPLLARSLPAVADVAHNELPTEARTGERLRRPGSARALNAVIEKHRDGFYGGEFGEGLIEAAGDEFTAADLDVDQARWVDAISVDAFGHRVWSVPPTSQGYITLLAAAIADGLDITDDGAGDHLLVEAALQASHDRPIALHEGADPAALLASARVAERRAAIDPDQAATIEVPTFDGDTTYLCAVDRDGMGVSLINSNASGFGAEIVAGSSGIFLQDRGHGFSLQAGHPAEYGPGRRPPHTLAPALVTHTDDSLRTVVGTMGGDAQPQVVLQLLASLLLHGDDPGRAIGKGRWRIATEPNTGFDTWRTGVRRVVELEEHVPGPVADALLLRGHSLGLNEHGAFGHAHVIDVGEHGLAGAADPRALAGSATGY